MSLTTFTTQRQLMRKNMPASALDNPFAQQQKILLYLLPLIFAVSGVNFPIGVLIYWLTTNLWSMGQQFYVIRRMPAPGSLAEQAKKERQDRRGKLATESTPPGDQSEAEASRSPSQAAGSSSGKSVREGPAGGQRQQPKRQQSRSKRSGHGHPRPAGPAARGGGRAGADGSD
jgi:YidC/Oxa1 family membrane protein insertase